MDPHYNSPPNYHAIQQQSPPLPQLQPISHLWPLFCRYIVTFVLFNATMTLVAHVILGLIMPSDGNICLAIKTDNVIDVVDLKTGTMTTHLQHLTSVTSIAESGVDILYVSGRESDGNDLISSYKMNRRHGLSGVPPEILLSPYEVISDFENIHYIHYDDVEDFLGICVKTSSGNHTWYVFSISSQTLGNRIFSANRHCGEFLKLEGSRKGSIFIGLHENGEIYDLKRDEVLISNVTGNLSPQMKILGISTNYHADKNCSMNDYAYILYSHGESYGNPSLNYIVLAVVHIPSGELVSQSDMIPDAMNGDVDFYQTDRDSWLSVATRYDRDEDIHVRTLTLLRLESNCQDVHSVEAAFTFDPKVCHSSTRDIETALMMSCYPGVEISASVILVMSLISLFVGCILMLGLVCTIRSCRDKKYISSGILIILVIFVLILRYAIYN